MGNYKSKRSHRQFRFECELAGRVSWSSAQYEWSA